MQQPKLAERTQKWYRQLHCRSGYVKWGVCISRLPEPANAFQLVSGYAGTPNYSSDRQEFRRWAKQP